ncbi:MAG: OsmC family protein [Candidatus Thermoplasmatota archaeon]|nr:OsmC family protein [Candidatus Thermoplasmatota archaeon]
MKTFRSSARWIGEKQGELTFENGEKVDFSSPVDFGGMDGFVVPEELLIASLNACLHVTFLTFAQKMRIEVRSFESEAEGHLDETNDTIRFVGCTVRLRVLVASERDVKRAEKAVSLAEKRCFISNSVSFEVSMESTIRVGEIE